MTVSRVINDHPNVSEETRLKVLEAVKKLGYRPNPAARALATRQHKRIGIIVDGAGNYGPDATLRAIERSACDAGYTTVSISIVSNPATSLPRAFDHLYNTGIDAICVIPGSSAALEAWRSLSHEIPALVVKDDAETPHLVAHIDQASGVELAMRHLQALGHRAIQHLAGPEGWLDAQAREGAWRAYVRSAGLELLPVLRGDWSSHSGYRIGATVPLELSCTAVLVANDQMALGLLHGLAERGVRAPRDLSIVGFDDAPGTQYYAPPLTTVRQDFQLLGERITDMLLSALNHERGDSEGILAPFLVVRGSTGPTPPKRRCAAPELDVREPRESGF